MRLLKDERGFTLTEILVTTIMMVVVLSALSSVFDMSLRVFSFGNNKVEAVETSRVAMEKMEREIRQAYRLQYGLPTCICSTSGVPHPPRSGSETTSTAMDLSHVHATGPACEKIGYQLNGNTLGRDNTSTGATNTVANLQPVAENVQNLTFTYYDQNGDVVDPSDPEVIADPVAAEAKIDRVQVSLDVSVDRGIGNPATQTLTSVIDLRNR